MFFSYLYKDDEGLYILCIVFWGGVSDYSVFLFVRDVDLLVIGVFGVFMDL